MSSFACENCACAFEHGYDLRSHYRHCHGIRSMTSAIFWPEFSMTEYVRLHFWRSMRLEGWAFAREDTTRPQVGGLHGALEVIS